MRVNSLVLSREWGMGLWDYYFGDLKGLSIGNHSPIPY